MALNTGKKWSFEEDNKLVQEINDKKSFYDIALCHKRTILGIKSRVILKIIYPKYKNNIDIDYLVKEYNIEKFLVQRYIKNIEDKEKIKNIEEREQELETKIKNIEEREQELETKIKNLEVREQELETKIKNIEEREQELEIMLSEENLTESLDWEDDSDDEDDSEVDAGGDEDDEDDLENVIVQQLEAIDTEVKEIILPLIVTFKQDGESILASTWWQFYDARMCIQSRLKYIFDCHARISELLIQSLLKLDGVVCATFEKARQKRKNLVKWIQEELDQIDMLRERVDQELTPVSKNAAVIIGGVIGVAAMATYALYTFSQSTTSDEDN